MPVGAAALLALAACASHVARTRELRPLLVRQDYATALRAIEPTNTAGSRLLYLYERGLILHESGDLQASNQALDRADRLREDLYTKSVSRELASLLLTDNLLEYRGDRFEAALVHYYKTMNYLRLGKLEDAAVECRRLNHELAVFRDQGGSFYRDDPFLQYFTGMVYAAAGEGADADVSLRQARESFREMGPECGLEAPRSLLCDLAENSAALGDAENARRYREEGSCPPAPVTATGRLNLFLECGYVPAKIERELVLPIYKDEVREDLDQEAYCRELAARYDRPRESGRRLDYLLKIALPVLYVPPPRYVSARIHPVGSIDSAVTPVRAMLVEDLAVLARRSLEEKQAQVLARAVARGFAKYLATREAKKKKGRAAGWLVNLAGAATEVADTRTWSTLPERIFMGRLDLPPGTWDLEVELIGPAGERARFVHIPGVEIGAGRTRFLSHRVY